MTLNPLTEMHVGAFRRAEAAERECERLRGLLAIARQGLRDASEGLDERGPHGTYCEVVLALRRSNPDADPS